MQDFISQANIILTAALLVSGIIAVLSVLTYLLDILKGYDLSDQYGWRNFRKPVIGFALIFSSLLSIILVVLILVSAK